VKLRSLRVRLLLGAAAAIFAALAASWLALTLMFERHIERRVEADLTRTARQLVAGLATGPSGAPVTEAKPADVRFSQPASGLYWQVSTSKAVLRSPSLWDQRLPEAPTATGSEWKTRTAEGPFDQRLLLLERTVRPDRNGEPVLVQLAQDRASISAARNEFGRELAQYLALLWLVLSVAAWLQVHLGLRPLKRVRAELAGLRTSPAARLSTEHVSEVKPLTEAINALADAREQDLLAARRRAADLAHSLKTPLAALAAQSRRAREAGAEAAADGLDRAIATASAAVDAELARARVARARRAEPGSSASALAGIERVVGVVERTDFGAARVFEVNVPEDLIVPLGPDDLAELMGALIENAARHARRRVRITGVREMAASHPACQLSVEDDGLGLEAGRAAEALIRGVRLDESGPGHGLGLSIARDLVEATGGALTIDTSELGGLRVVIRWPARAEI
jgi:signal transduction histidine kinase